MPNDSYIRLTPKDKTGHDPNRIMLYMREQWSPDEVRHVITDAFPDGERTAKQPTVLTEAEIQALICAYQED